MACRPAAALGSLPETSPPCPSANGSSAAAAAAADVVMTSGGVSVGDHDLVQAALKAAGVPTVVHYPKPLHRQPAYASYCCADCCPESVHAGREVMSLPMHPYMSADTQQRIVAALEMAVPA